MFKVKKSKGNIRRKDNNTGDRQGQGQKQEEEGVVEVTIDGMTDNSTASIPAAFTRRSVIQQQQQQQRNNNPLVLSKPKKTAATSSSMRPIEDYALKHTTESQPLEESTTIITTPIDSMEDTIPLQQQQHDDEDEDLVVGEDYSNTKEIPFGLNAVKELTREQNRLRQEQLKEGLTHINLEEDEEFLKLEHDVIRKAIGNKSFILFNSINYEESKQKKRLLQQINNNQQQQQQQQQPEKDLMKSFDEYLNCLESELDLLNSEIHRREEILQELNYELQLIV